MLTEFFTRTRAGICMAELALAALAMGMIMVPTLDVLRSGVRGTNQSVQLTRAFQVGRAMVDAIHATPCEQLDDASLADLAIRSGFTMTDELSGTAWMDADQRPPVAQIDGFAIVDRVTRADRPHPMIARNGELVEPRLRQCSLYDPTLDLAVEDADGRVAGYALFWFDHTTLVGLLEPMRVEDGYQRRGLARMLLTNGLDRLARTGARRLKVGFETDAARNLYLGAGFVQTSIDRLLIRAVH